MGEGVGGEYVGGSRLNSKCVDLLEEDFPSLLPPEGEPGQFRISYSLTCSANCECEGSIALLQVHDPERLESRSMYNPFAFALLDCAMDTKGEFIEVIPGIKYKVTTKTERVRRGFFRSQERFVLQTEVHISDHPETKVWLVEIPVQYFLTYSRSDFQIRTLYRRGLWRKKDLYYLQKTFPILLS